MKLLSRVLGGEAKDTVRGGCLATLKCSVSIVVEEQ